MNRRLPAGRNYLCLCAPHLTPAIIPAPPHTTGYLPPPVAAPTTLPPLPVPCRLPHTYMPHCPPLPHHAARFTHLHTLHTHLAWAPSGVPPTCKLQIPTHRFPHSAGMPASSWAETAGATTTAVLGRLATGSFLQYCDDGQHSGLVCTRVTGTVPDSVPLLCSCVPRLYVFHPPRTRCCLGLACRVYIL